MNYSTIKKEILSIVLCISKFQSDLLNQNFLIRIDCKSAKHVLEKIFKTLHQNKVLHDGKPSFLFLTLILNSLKELKTVSLISLPVNFCRVQTTMSRKKVQQLETPRFPKPSPSTPKSTSQAKNPASQLVPVTQQP